MTTRPNIVLILTDQYQQRILGAYGNRTVHTPRLDALAKQSVLFHNAIVAQPVCTASRASLLTGTYGHTHGCIINGRTLTTEVPTYGEIFGGHGYRCGYIGKWHLGNETLPQRGFEGFYCSTDDQHSTYELREQGYYSAYHHHLIERGYTPQSGREYPYFSERDATKLPEEHSKVAFMAQKFDEFVTTSKDGPFFLTVSILEPHPPYFGPFDDMYPVEQVQLPPNYHVDDEERAGWSRRNQRFQEFYFNKGHNIRTGDVEDVLVNTARYYGLVSLVDKYVGRMLDALEAQGLADNTIVIFTSDHGDMLGSHQMVDKGQMFEESIKVPFMLRDPRRRQGGECNQVINNVDILPTLLDMAGLPVPEHVQGRSFVPLLDGQREKFPDFGVVEWNGVLQNMHRRQPMFADVLDLHVRCVVTPEWKLVLSPGDRSELYDLKADPFERRNVFDDPANQEIVEQLYSRLRQWQAETNDPLEVPHPFAKSVR